MKKEKKRKNSLQRNERKTKKMTTRPRSVRLGSNSNNASENPLLYCLESLATEIKPTFALWRSIIMN